MCTQTFSNYTTARFISKVNAVHYVNRCQCGFCSECIRQKKSEWALRAYYEAKDCFSRGGFCLFDTLTYRDNDLKWFHDYYGLVKDEPFDFMAFSRDDVKHFFKRLRISLKRLGFDVDGKLRYLVTSEYGSELKTNRPHYHVLFFVYFDIDPIKFSKAVSTAWIHGITDGVQPDHAIEPWYAYKSKAYVLQNRVFRDARYELNKLVNYVVKYITKDFYVYKKLFKRVYKTFSMIHPNWCQYYSQRLAFRRFKSQVLPFHLQSKGFGLYALESIGVDEILRLNSIPLPFQNNGVCAFIPLPLYFKRKLFYQTGWFEGRLRWFLNEAGKIWKLKQLDNSIKNYSYRLQSWRNDIDSLELANYQFLKRGVLVPKFMLDYSYDDLKKELLSVPALRPLYDSDLLFYNYTTPVYKFLGGSFVSDRYHSENLSNEFSSWCVSPAGFLQQNDDLVLLNDPLKDSVLEEFEKYLYDVGKTKIAIDENKDCQKFRYKELGLL